MKTIWLIGCGNIGFRHLQAILAMPEASKIVVIEPAVALHERIAATIAQPHAAAHQVSLIGEMPEAGKADLAVVATAAPPRSAIVRSLTQNDSPRAIILEKVLAQTDADLRAMDADLADAGSIAHVNCPRRYFPGYQKLRTVLSEAGPLSIDVRGSQFGLGSNAVHFLDLLEYLNGSPLVSINPSALEPDGKPSKRAGFQEIYGTLYARLENGAMLRIDCADKPTVSLGLVVTTADGRSLTINEGEQSMTGPDGNETVFETRFVSQTPEIYSDALAGHCGLTAFADSLRQHEIYLAALRLHFGLASDQPVPVS